MTSNGYIWRFKDNPLTDDYLNKIKNKRPKTKKVYQYDLNNNLLNIYNSVTEASKKTGLNYGCISHTCRGGWTQYQGYKWSYDQ